MIALRIVLIRTLLSVQMAMNRNRKADFCLGSNPLKKKFPMSSKQWFQRLPQHLRLLWSEKVKRISENSSQIWLGTTMKHVRVKQLKQAKHLCKEIQKQYLGHGIKLKLLPCTYNPSTQGFVFSINKVAPGTKIGNISLRAKDVRIALKLQLLHLEERDSQLFLVASYGKVECLFSQMLKHPIFQSHPHQLLIALGKNLDGHPIFIDLSDAPHALYAGATNSGKSTALICLILSLICHHSVNEVNLVLFDMGGKSLEVFEGVPHLSFPIVNDEVTGAHAVDAIYQEMNRRLSLGTEEIDSLPAVVCVIDEFVSFMNRTKKLPNVADQITDILRRGRKAKTHMVFATQDTKVSSMCVNIDNITTRMAFKCASYHASISILNCRGAELLSGKGQMLYVSAEHPTPTFIQGAYISPQEVKELVASISSQAADSSLKFVIPEISEGPTSTEATGSAFHAPAALVSEEDHKKADVIMWTLGNDTISARKIEKQIPANPKISTHSAKRLINFLTDQGIVSQPHYKQPRTVLINHPKQLPEPILELLHICGYSDEAITAAFGNRISESTMEVESTEATPLEDA